MQTIVSVRYTRQLCDDVGIPPEPMAVKEGDIHKVLSGHAAWLEERGFAERVPVYRQAPVPSSDLDAFLSQLTADLRVADLRGAGMKGPHENKAIAPAQDKRKRGRPKGTKNKPKP